MAYNDRETLSTLRFGNRAKAIKNKPIANAQRSAKELLGELEKSKCICWETRTSDQNSSRVFEHIFSK